MSSSSSSSEASVKTPLPKSILEQVLTLKKIEAFCLALRRRFLIFLLSNFCIDKQFHGSTFTTTKYEGHTIESMEDVQQVLTTVLLPSYKLYELPFWSISLASRAACPQGFHPEGPTPKTFREWFQCQLKGRWKCATQDFSAAILVALLNQEKLWAAYWHIVYQFIMRMYNEDSSEDEEWGWLAPSNDPDESDEEEREEEREEEKEERITFKTKEVDAMLHGFFKPSTSAKMSECFIEATAHLGHDQEHVAWLKKMREDPIPKNIHDKWREKTQQQLFLLRKLHDKALAWHKDYLDELLEQDHEEKEDEFMRKSVGLIPTLISFNATTYQQHMNRCIPNMEFPFKEFAVTKFLYSFSYEFWAGVHDTFFQTVKTGAFPCPDWFDNSWMKSFRHSYAKVCVSEVLDFKADEAKMLHPIHFMAYVGREKRGLVPHWFQDVIHKRDLEVRKVNDHESNPSESVDAAAPGAKRLKPSEREK
jgi:hypothetical protein